jgi:hypothetical protein
MMLLDKVQCSCLSPGEDDAAGQGIVQLSVTGFRYRGLSLGSGSDAAAGQSSVAASQLSHLGGRIMLFDKLWVVGGCLSHWPTHEQA